MIFSLKCTIMRLSVELHPNSVGGQSASQVPIQLGGFKGGNGSRMGKGSEGRVTGG